MSANIKASTDGTQAIIGVGGVDQMTVSNAGVVTANSFVGNVTGNIAGNVTGGTISGNASSATALATGSTTARTLANRFAEVVNVLDFGADNTGATDCVASINNAITFAFNNGGGTVYFPSGTYSIASYSGIYGTEGNYYTVVPKTGVSILGDGPDTIFKMSTLLRTGVPSGQIRGIGFLYDNLNEISNVRYSNFTVDWNGQNMPNIPTTTNVNRLGTSAGASNWHIDNVTFLNPSGHHNIWLSSPTPSTLYLNSYSGNSITNCNFRNAGRAVAGNTLVSDHSSIYCGVHNTIISNNTFWCDNNNDTVATAIEIHGCNINCVNNTIYNYSKAFNLANDLGNAFNQIVSDNNIFQVQYGMTVWSQTTNSSNYISILNNNIILRPTTFGYGIGSYSTSPTSSGNITISNNLIQLENETDPLNVSVGIQVQNFSSPTITNNKIMNFSGEGINYSTISGSTNGNTVNISNNIIEACGYTTRVIGGLRKRGIYIDATASTPNKINRCYINDNKIITAVPFGIAGTVAQYGIYILANIDELHIKNNVTQYQSIQSIYRIANSSTITLIEHSGNEDPYDFLSATYGSIYRSTTTPAKIWRACRPGFNGQVTVWMAEWYDTAIPTTGYNYPGDRVIKSNPSVGQPKAWVCTTAGTPGTWVSEGNL